MYWENDYIIYDHSEPTYCKLIYKKKEPTEKEFQDFLNWNNEVYQQAKQPFVLLVDARFSPKYVNKELRTEAVDWMKEHKDLLQRWNYATAFLNDGITQKLILQAIFALAPFPSLYMVTNKESKALTWLDERKKELLGQRSTSPSGQQTGSFSA